MSFEDYLKKKELSMVKKKVTSTRSIIKEERQMGSDNREVIQRLDMLEDKLDLILDALTEIVEDAPEAPVVQKKSKRRTKVIEESSPLAEMFNRQAPSIDAVQQQVHDTTFAAANLFEDTESLSESAIMDLAKEADVSLLSTASNVPHPAKTDVVDLTAASNILG